MPLADLPTPALKSATASQNTSRTTWTLTLAQLDFWEEFCFHPDQPISTVAHGIEIIGPADPDALAKAIAQTAREADVLALRFIPPADDEKNAAPMQVVDPARRPELHEMDLRDRADPEGLARAVMQADINAPLDLARDPLSAQWLLRLGEARWIWYARGHHIILDGYSMALLEQRCATLYAHFIGRGPAGEPLKPFTAYLEEEETYRASPRHAKDQAFWRDHLTASTSAALPVLQKGGETYGGEMLEAEIALPEAMPAALHALSAQTAINWPDLLTLLSGAYLSSCLTLPDQSPADIGRPLAIWLPYMSRLGSVSAAIPALVVNILPLKVQVDPEETLERFLMRQGALLRRIRRHGRCRIEQIAADHGLGRGQRFFFSPLINVLPFDPPVFPDCTVEREVLAAGPGDGFNMTFAARSDGHGLHLCLEADPAITSAQAFARHSEALPAFLKAALAPHAGTRLIADLLPTHSDHPFEA